MLIVNYNGATHLPACLTALEQQTLPRRQFEVIVVDNASSDNSVTLMRERFPWVQVIALDRNSGFAEGNDIAARRSRGSVLALLNNDTIPDTFWLDELLRAIEKTPNAAVASKLVFAHDPTLVNSAGLFLLRDGRGADRGFRQHDAGQFETEGPTFGGCGAAVAIPAPERGEPIFDSNYFVYYEDLDAAWRFRLRGGRFTYAPRSLVRHVHGAATGEGSPFFLFHVERNRALTALRNADPFLAVFSAAVLFAKIPQAWVRAALGSPKGVANAWAVTQAAVSYCLRAPDVLTGRFAEFSRDIGGERRCGS